MHSLPICQSENTLVERNKESHFLVQWRSHCLFDPQFQSLNTSETFILLCIEMKNKNHVSYLLQNCSSTKIWVEGP